ncbi:MAG: hybrid sensor histidine kinase/response regulator [Phaeodactylibacter sp.]|nr:hybrid sensor histidine kinase/response regulator [Phaeodactylibacter sp.]
MAGNVKILAIEMNNTITILVVEDEVSFEKLIRQRLRQEVKNGSYSFVFAGNGQEALALLEVNKEIDIVLIDINMPVMDGLTLLSYLRKDKQQLITVIILANDDMPKIRTAMNLGAFDFVIKPIDFTDLKATIQKAIRELKVIRQAAKARELELMNEQLCQVGRMKSQFLTNISHEFRTPLMVIDGMSDQIVAKPDRWLIRGIQLIKRNSAHLLDMVNQILELTELDDGSLKLNLVQDNIVSYLYQVIEPFYNLAERKNIQLSILDELSELKMDYDPRKLQRVLSNLLSNAIKFNKPGGKIWVKLQGAKSSDFIGSPVGSPEQADWLLLTVKDTGVGIPEGQLSFIFNRFYQGDGSSTRSADGTGIGLALVKELLELMGGQVSVFSRASEGATFQIALPIRRDTSTL